LAHNAFSNRGFTFGLTSAFSPRAISETRFNYSANRARQVNDSDRFGGAVPTDLASLTSGYSGGGKIAGFVAFNLPGAQSRTVQLGDLVDSQQRQISFAENVTLIISGTHRLKFGGDYRRLAPVFGPRAYEQQMFLNTESDIVNGLVSQLNQFSRIRTRPLFDNFSAYAQDSWKVSTTLTLEYGVRWDLNPPPREASGITSVLIEGVENIMTAHLAPSGAPLYKTFYKGFAPRFGIAYTLRSRKTTETVLRGGFGFFYDLGAGQATAGLGFGFPFIASKTTRSVPYPISPTLGAPPPFPAVALPITNDLFATNPGLKLPHTLQWNITVEQTFGNHDSVTLAYVASAGRNLLATQYLNQRIGNPSTGPRPNPNFAGIRYTIHGPSADYHSLQAQYRRRLSDGLQVLANYTWSHAIDEISNEVEISGLERGNASFDVRHNFTAALTYDLPHPHGSAAVISLLRDWRTALTLYAQTGQPLELSAGTMIRADGNSVSVRPDFIGGQSLWIKDPSVAGGQRLNSAAFALPPTVPGASGFFTRQGTLPRNYVRLPGLYQIDTSLERQFRLGENLRVGLKAEAFNVLNHPMFGGYANFVGSPSTLGVPSQTLNSSLGGLSPLYQIGGPRSLQFSLRLTF